MSHTSLIELANATDKQLSGGKASALAALIQAGFTVPDGFVVPALFALDSPSTEQQIMEAFDRLNASFVAVRSSAINEDSAEASWAGQLDTFLNVSRNTLISSIKSCLRSGQSERAQAYAAANHATASNVAVLVQAMIQSEVSGVGFSVNPVTGARDEVMIEACLGLGEALVCGEVTPDNYLVQKSTRKITSTYVAEQARKLALGQAGNEWEKLISPAKTPKLSPVQLDELVRLLIKLEAHLGHPVDVEWAFANHTLYVLQARPITNLD